MKQIIFTCCVILLSGCSTRGELTAKASGEIGCPPSEITVSEAEIGWDTKTWSATCRGKTFYCTYMSSLNLGSSTKCKEGITPASK